MKTITHILVALILSVSLQTFAQQTDSLQNTYANSGDILFEKNEKIGIGGYAEVHYNQPITSNQKDIGTVDVHRMVMFLGYSFSPKTQFVSEIEFEYANELWVEQAYLQHKLHKYINFKTGLILVPMGIINEYHEPSTFNGVERPIIDNKIGLATWREIGIGLTGNILPYSLKYQAYIVNGLNGYDTKAIFTGAKGLRDGRQKGSKAYVTSPCFTGKLEYYGFQHINLGLSGYAGKSQSKLYNKVATSDTERMQQADSSTIGIGMIGSDIRFQKSALEMRGQLYYTKLYNTYEYNEFTSNPTKQNDLGNALLGYYIEAGYNIFKHINNAKSQFIPFVRYEYFDLHHSTNTNIEKNNLYAQQIITSGITYKITKDAALKADIQFLNHPNETTKQKIFNAGFGVMF